MRADQETLQSIGWYAGLIFLVGQFAARVFLDVPLDKLFLGITGVMVLGPMFGPAFVVALVKAVRGVNDGGGPDDS